MTDRETPPIVPNDWWTPTRYEPPKWCRPRWWSFPRRHRPFTFLMFDPGLPRYRRCPRCGFTTYDLSRPA